MYCHKQSLHSKANLPTIDPRKQTPKRNPYDSIHKVVLRFTSKAGDHVKFGFPMAASTTLLAWGLLEYKDAYEQSGQLEYMYGCIRWPLEWMLKCHTGHNELYVQVIVQKHTHRMQRIQ